MKSFAALLLLTSSFPISALAAHAKVEVRQVAIDGSGDKLDVVFVDEKPYATYQAGYAEDVPVNLGPLNFFWGNVKKRASREAIALCQSKQGRDCRLEIVQSDGCYTFEYNPVDHGKATNCSATAYAIDASNPGTQVSERTWDGPQY
jgi:hypothetical protein